MLNKKLAVTFVFLLSALVAGASLSFARGVSASISPRNTYTLNPLQDSYVGSSNWPKQYTYTLTLTASANSTAYFYLKENVTDVILWNVTLTPVSQNFTYQTQGPKNFFMRLANPSPSAVSNVTWDIDTDFDSGDGIPGYETILFTGAILLGTTCVVLSRRLRQRET